LTSADVKHRAREIGFDACGIAPATDLPELSALATWLERGHAGQMVYLHKSAETRADVRRFLPGARAVVMTASLYNTGAVPVRGALRGPRRRTLRARRGLSSCSPSASMAPGLERDRHSERSRQRFATSIMCRSGCTPAMRVWGGSARTPV
jgi:hypothetical protein